MASAAEAIILSSSPEPPARTPAQASCDPETSIDISSRDPTPPSLTSPSELFRPPSRSRFFAEQNITDRATNNKRQTTKKATTANAVTKKATSKPPRRAKKAAKETNSAVLEAIEPGTLDSRDNTACKAPVPRKGRSQSGAKSKKPGNMVLAGKVTKTNKDSLGKDSEKAEKKLSSAQKSSDDLQAKKSNALQEGENLQLDEAMSRRRDWTPPKETASIGVSALYNDEDHKMHEDGQFGRRISDYNYSGSDPELRDVSLNTDDGGPTKRRRIEVRELGSGFDS